VKAWGRNHIPLSLDIHFVRAVDPMDDGAVGWPPIIKVVMTCAAARLGYHRCFRQSAPDALG
jgi:hypothetical protein